MLRIYLLGLPHFFLDSEPYSFTAPPRTLPLFVYLLLSHSQVYERTQAACALWPEESDETARTNLRRHVHYLQQALPPCKPDQPWLISNRTNLGWNPQTDFWLDTAEFEQSSARPACLEQAVDFYTADLATNIYDDWIFAERERLRRLFIQDLDQLVEQAHGAKDFPRAIRFAQKRLAVDPLHEDAARELMALRYETGDRAGALQEYERFRRLLDQELGVEPMPETQHFYKQVLKDIRFSVVSRIQDQTEGEKHPPEKALLSLPDELPFTGREQELNWLKEKWHQALGGKGGIFLIGGEAGVGKTRLVQEFAASLDARPEIILWGKTGFVQARPYQTLTSALEGVLPDLLSLNPDPVWLAVLAQILPELGRYTRQKLPLLEPEQEKIRLFDAVAAYIEALAHKGGVLLVMEDLHWAGQSLIELVEFIANRIKFLPVLILGTYREEESSRGHPIRRLRQRLAAETGGGHLSLDCLHPPAVAKLLAGIFPQAGRLEADVKARLQNDCEGNPLFLDLLLRSWANKLETSEAGQAQRPSNIQGPVHVSAAESGVPAGIQKIIQPRLEHLSPNALTLAEAGAVIGPLFSLELVSEVLGWPEARIEEAAGELLDQRIIRCGSGQAGADYEYSHLLIQACLYQGLPPGRARRWHLRTAQVIEDLVPVRLEDVLQRLNTNFASEDRGLENRKIPAGELAHHYDRGGVTHKAIACYALEAENCLELSGDEEALSMAGRGLELIAQNCAQIRPGLHFRLLGLCESIYQRLGQRSDQKTELEQMLTLAKKSRSLELTCEVQRRRIEFSRGAGDRRAERAAVEQLKNCAQSLGSPHWIAEGLRQEACLLALTNQEDKARQQLVGAMEAFKDAGLVDGQLACASDLARLEILHWNGDGAQYWIDSAFSITHSTDKQYLVEPLLWAASGAALSRNEYETAIHFGQQLLALATTLRDRTWEARSHNHIGLACSRLFRIQEARDHLAAAETIFKEIGEEDDLGLVLINQGIVALTVGNYNLANRYFALSEELGEKLENGRILAIALANHATAASFQEDYPAVRRLGLRALRTARRFRLPYVEAHALNNQAEAERELGHLDIALELAQKAEAIFKRLGHAEERLMMVHEITLIYLATGQTQTAIPLVAEILAAYPDMAGKTDDAQRYLWAAARVKQAIGETGEAASLLKAAFDLVQEKVAAIPDQESRRALLGLKMNREIIQAYENGLVAAA